MDDAGTKRCVRGREHGSCYYERGSNHQVRLPGPYENVPKDILVDDNCVTGGTVVCHGGTRSRRFLPVGSSEGPYDTAQVPGYGARRAREEASVLPILVTRVPGVCKYVSG